MSLAEIKLKMAQAKTDGRIWFAISYVTFNLGYLESDDVYILYMIDNLSGISRTEFAYDSAEIRDVIYLAINNDL